MAAPIFSPISYDMFLADLERVALALEADDWTPDFLIGIGRGGLVPAAYLSHRTGIALLTVDHSSGEVGFADELLDKLAAKIRAGQHLLIVDDINDSGATIAYLRAAITAKSGDPAGLRVAVLIDNVCSQAKADYRGSEIDRSRDKSWFVFPWEALGTTESLVADAAAVPERIA